MYPKCPNEFVDLFIRYIRMYTLLSHAKNVDNLEKNRLPKSTLPKIHDWIMRFTHTTHLVFASTGFFLDKLPEVLWFSEKGFEFTAFASEVKN